MNKRYLQNYQDTVNALEAQWGDELAQMAADFFMFPAEHALYAHWKNDALTTKIGFAAYLIVKKWLLDKQRAEILPALAQRIQYHLGNLSVDVEVFREDIQSWDPAHTSYQPSLSTCLQMLPVLAMHHEALDTILHVVSGDWNQSLAGPARHPILEGSHSYQTSFVAQALCSCADDLLKTLFDAGLLTFEVYGCFVRQVPAVIARHPRDPDYKTEDAFADMLDEYASRLCWEAMAAQDPQAFACLSALGYTRRGSRLRGARWLLKACDYIEARGLQLDAALRYDDAQRPIINLAAIASLTDADDPAGMEARLAGFTRATLLSVLPFAGAAQDTVLRVLGMEKMIPLRCWIAQSAGLEPDWNPGFIHEFHISGYKGFGDINLKSTQQLLAQVGEKAALEFMKLLKNANADLGPIQAMLESVLGKNRKRVLGLASKFNLRALVLLGLLPLEASENALDRYRVFKQLTRESRRFGTERRSEIAAAIDIGLRHLACHAGFKQFIAFEWAMEAQLPLEIDRFAERQLDECLVEVVIDEEAPQLRISKQGKYLKTVPAALKKNPVLLDMQLACAELAAQRQRLRATLEAYMVEGTSIPVSSVRLLHQIPAAKPLLNGLLFKTGDGRFGLFSVEADVLHDHTGQDIGYKEDLSIAHAAELAQAGLLSSWKTQLAARALAPLEQIARPVYTVATLGGDFRFGSGTVVDTRKASKLLAQRDWVLSYDEDAGSVTRTFKHCGLNLQMVFRDNGRFLAEEAQATFDYLAFYSHKSIAFPDVPPAIFSEAWRDVHDMFAASQV